MKLRFKTMLVMLSIIAVSCSEDEKVPNSARIPIEQVPSGEVIRVDEREETLSGYSEDGVNDEAQIWWQHVVKTVTHDCPATYGEDGATETSSLDTVVAFKNDGKVYKINLEGEEEVIAVWGWLSDYSGIRIDGTPYKLNALNANELVFYNFTGSEDCNTLVWEQLVQE